jgi:hypothetical protein
MADVRPHAAHLLLIGMALTAKDSNPRYYGGAEWLALGLNIDRRRVNRLLNSLADDGWIKPDGYEHGRRVWLLILPGPGATPDQHTSGG